MSEWDDWFDDDTVPPAVAKTFPGATRIPTTDEMDGLFTPEDRADKHKVMAQCQSCNEWTQIEVWKPPLPCFNCGQKNYDSTSFTSLRTFNPHNKRTAKGYKKKR